MTFEEKINKEAKNYYQISQTINNLPPQNRETSRQIKTYISIYAVLRVYAEDVASLKEDNKALDKTVSALNLKLLEDEKQVEDGKQKLKQIIDTYQQCKIFCNLKCKLCVSDELNRLEEALKDK